MPNSPPSPIPLLSRRERGIKKKRVLDRDQSLVLRLSFDVRHHDNPSSPSPGVARRRELSPITEGEGAGQQGGMR